MRIPYLERDPFGGLENIEDRDFHPIPRPLRYSLISPTVYVS